MKNQRGFSLIEVTLALGIVAFVLIPLMAMLPIGMRNASASVQQTGAVNIANAIFADRQASPFGSESILYKIPSPTNSATNSFLIGLDGQKTGQIPPGYYVQYKITAPAANVGTPAMLHLQFFHSTNTANLPILEVISAIPKS